MQFSSAEQCVELYCVVASRRRRLVVKVIMEARFTRNSRNLVPFGKESVMSRLVTQSFVVNQVISLTYQRAVVPASL